MRFAITLCLSLAAGAAPAFEGQDAYGPGVHMDATGRAYSYDNQVPPGARIQRDAYGPDVDMDETGRPLERKPHWAPRLPLLFRGGDSAN